MEQYIRLLIHSALQSDESTRRKAENEINTLRNHKEFPVTLINLVLFDSVQEIRLLSAIILKAYIESLSISELSHGSLEHILSKIHNLLSFSTPPCIRSQFFCIFLKIFSEISITDHIKLSIVQALVENQIDYFYSSIQIVRVLLKIHKISVLKLDLTDFFLATSQAMLELLQRLLKDSNNNVKWDFILISLKAFHQLLDLKILEFNSNTVDQLLISVKALLEPDCSNPSIVKIVNNCGKIIYCYGYTYFECTYLFSQASRTKEILLALFASVHNFIMGKRNDNFTVNSVLIKIMTLAYCLHFSKNLANSYTSSLFDVIFNVLKLNALDQELWELNPDEFISVDSNILDSDGPLRSAVINLLVAMSEDNLPYLMQVIKEHISKCNWVDQECLLHIVGHISETLLVKNYSVVDIENFLYGSCRILLDSSCPYLRYRSIWVYLKFAFVEFAIPYHFETIVAKLLESIKDCQSCVKIISTITLAIYIKKDLRILRCIKVNELIETCEAIINQSLSENALEAAGEIMNSILEAKDN